MKRFVDLLRYAAIRLRPGAGTDTGRFPEPTTFASATIHFFDESRLTQICSYLRFLRSFADQIPFPR